MRLWLNSVHYAWHGVKFAFRNERNMRIHGLLAATALTFVLLLDISVVKALFVILALALVLICELFNTAIEKTLDMIGPNPHPLAKAAKDCAAAAVLLSSIFAVVVGIMVFGPFIGEGSVWRWIGKH